MLPSCIGNYIWFRASPPLLRGVASSCMHRLYFILKFFSDIKKNAIPNPRWSNNLKNVWSKFQSRNDNSATNVTPALNKTPFRDDGEGFLQKNSEWFSDISGWRRQWVTTLSFALEERKEGFVDEYTANEWGMISLLGKRKLCLKNAVRERVLCRGKFKI